MKRQYQIEQQRAVQQFRRIATEENPKIQMILPLAEIVGLLQQGVGNLLRETGLALMQTVMEEEVRHLAGERYQQHEAGRRAHRWGKRGRLLRGGRPESTDPDKDKVANQSTNGNSAWAATSSFSAAVRCKRKCGTSMMRGLSTRKLRSCGEVISTTPMASRNRR